MATIGTLSVTLQATTDQFIASMNKVEGKLGKVGDAAGKASLKMAAAFAAVSATIGKSIQLASKQEEAELKLAGAIAASGNAIDPQRIKAYASALQKVTTFGDEATISAAAMLTTFQLQEDEIIALLPRVQNLAAMYGGDLNSNAIRIGKAIQKGAGVLSEFGVVLTDAQKKAFDMADTTGKVAQLMTILDANTGNAAEAMAQTAGGAMVQMKNATGDLFEEFGKILSMDFVPGVERWQGAIEMATEAIKGLSDETKATISAVAAGVAAFLGIGAALLGVAAILPQVAMGFTMMGRGLAIAAKWVDIKRQTVWAYLKALAPLLIKLALIGVVIAGVIVAVGSLKRAWDQNMFGIQDTTKSVMDKVKLAIAAIKETLKDVSKFGVLAFAWMTGMDPDEAGAIVREIEKTESGLLENASERLQEGLSAAADMGKDMINQLSDGMSDVAGDAADIGEQIWGGMKDIGGDLSKDLQAGIETLGLGALGKNISELIEGAMDAAIPDKLKRIIADIKAAIAGAGAGAGPGAKDKPKLGPGGVAPGKGGKGADKDDPSMAKAGKLAADKFLGAAGEAGNLIKSGMEGAAAGGPWGAVMAVLIDLATMTEGFSEAMASLSKLVKVAAAAISPLMEALSPVVGTLSEMIIPLFRQLGIAFTMLAPIITAVGNFVAIVLQPIFSALQAVLEGFAPLLSVVAQVLSPIITLMAALVTPLLEVFLLQFHILGTVMGQLTEGIQWFTNNVIKKAVNFILNQVIGFLKILHKVADAIPGMGKVADSLKKTIDKLRDARMKDVDLNKDVASAAKKVDASMTKAAEETDKATASIANAPSGFKIALERFRSTQGAMGSPMAGALTGEHFGGAAGQPGATFNISEMTITADDPQGLADAMAKEEERRSLRTNGNVSSQTTLGRPATAR